MSWDKGIAGSLGRERISWKLNSPAYLLFQSTSRSVMAYLRTLVAN